MTVCGENVVLCLLKNDKKKFEHARIFCVVFQNVVFCFTEIDRVYQKNDA